MDAAKYCNDPFFWYDAICRIAMRNRTIFRQARAMGATKNEYGWVAERSKATVLKTVVSERGP